MGIRTGVIGFGLAGRVFHAPFVHAARGLDLHSIVQRNGDEAARAFPHAQVLRLADDLFHSDVELVVVGTPNNTHVPLARAAIEAGKHVVIDKPFAPTSAEAEELEALAQKQGVLLAPFHNRRFDGDFLTLRKLLDEGSLGRPVTLLSRFDRFRPVPRPNTWKETEGAEHGLLMDLGPHLVDQSLVLFGRPESITADVRTDRDATNIEDAFDITLHFERDGRKIRVDLGSTMIAAEPQPRFLLHGTAGSFRKSGVDPQEPAILAGATVPAQAEAADEWFTEDRAAWGTLTTPVHPGDPTRLRSEPVPTERGNYRVFYQGIAEAIRDGATPPTTPRDAIRVARLLEMARESSRTGRTLPVSPETW
ncbi:Gfo/Idh/MocA family oxidoreductase [Terriglobus sp.]|uniref:Gfo/Idh/MocA family oxidoreductase n=1 Tax=Terriglobus sp. TaxID=1889013 RepID=UPI003B0021DD